MLVGLRAVAVWTAATLAVVGVGRWLIAPVRLAVSGPAAFDDLLVALATSVLAAALAWLWLVGSVTLAAAALHADPTGLGPWAGPATVRRAVLAACGLGLLAVAASPAGASSAPRDDPARPQVLAGLPLPARAVAPTERSAPARVVVRPGDTLWALAAAALPARAGEPAIETGWRAIYRVNAGVVGPDPDLIVPGAVLRLPRLPTSPSEEP